jgi:hypothetical protein
VKGRNKVAELLIYVMEIFFVKPLFNMISLCISGHKKNYMWMTFWSSCICILHYYFIYYINTWEISNMRLKRPISSSGQVKHMEILIFYSFSLGVVVKSEWILFLLVMVRIWIVGSILSTLIQLIPFVVLSCAHRAIVRVGKLNF